MTQNEILDFIRDTMIDVFMYCENYEEVYYKVTSFGYDINGNPIDVYLDRYDAWCRKEYKNILKSHRDLKDIVYRNDGKPLPF